MKVYFWWTDDKVDLDIESLADIFKNPWVLSDPEDSPELDNYLREHGEDFKRNLRETIEEAISVVEQYGEDGLKWHDVRLFLPDDTFIAFRAEDEGHRLDASCSVEDLRRLLLNFAE